MKPNRLKYAYLRTPAEVRREAEARKLRGLAYCVVALLLLVFCVATVRAQDTAPPWGRACMALAVFYEARSESFLGQALVVQVILNRQAADFGKDPCEIVSAPGQFEGLERNPIPRKPWRQDPAAWAQAVAVVDAVTTGDYVIEPPRCAEATHFVLRDHPTPAWARPSGLVCSVDAHDFYVVY